MKWNRDDHSILIFLLFPPNSITVTTITMIILFNDNYDHHQAVAMCFYSLVLPRTKVRLPSALFDMMASLYVIIIIFFHNTSKPCDGLRIVDKRTLNLKFVILQLCLSPLALSAHLFYRRLLDAWADHYHHQHYDQHDHHHHYIVCSSHPWLNQTSGWKEQEENFDFFRMISPFNWRTKEDLWIFQIDFRELKEFEEHWPFLQNERKIKKSFWFQKKKL